MKPCAFGTLIALHESKARLLLLRSELWLRLIYVELGCRDKMDIKIATLLCEKQKITVITVS